MQGVLGEAANRQKRTFDGNRRDDGIDSRTVGQTGIDHGRRLVDAAAYLGDDLLNDPLQVGVYP